jgi:gliding motility-associated-like protein
MEKDRFEKLLKEQLGNHEMPVDPALWKNVAAQAGISTGSAGLGLGAWLGIAGGAALLTAGLIYSTSSKGDVAKARLKEPKEKTTLTAPVNAKEQVAIKTSETENAPTVVTEYPTKQVIHCDGDDATVILMPEKIQEPLVVQDNKAAEIAQTSERDPLAEAQSSSSSYPQEVSKQETQANNPTANSNPKSLVMPNAITPNGDGVNDALTLNAEGLTDFSVVVLDASNKVVFSSTDPEFVWNGFLPNGDPAPAGMYQYYYTAKDANGRWCNQFSMLTVLR